MIVKIGRIMSPSMLDMMVGLVWQKEKLTNASFTEIHFWTETLGEYLVN
jgi:cbb3-type cytochrome oxidase subunit 1